MKSNIKYMPYFYMEKNRMEWYNKINIILKCKEGFI